MTISQHQVHNQLVLTLKGKLVEKVRKTVQEAFDQARASHHRDLVVNLTEVPFMDSSGLGFLARTHDRLKQDQGQLTLVCPPGYVLDLLKLSNFHTLMAIVATEQEIEEKVAEPSR